MSDWIGRTLSKVILIKRLGRGAMAEVYLGHHTTLDRPVAVKVLHAHLVENNLLPERFQMEAQGVAALRQPNIVQVFDFDLAEGRPYIVMELVEGVSLESYLQSLQRSGRSLPPETTARLLLALAGALDYAHGRGIIHRDLKPANVMLRREGGRSPEEATFDPLQPLGADVEPVLMDFGLARFLDHKRLSASGSISGTPAYISPEQIRGEPLDARSDIYSLGVMLYEMLAGRLPFDSEDENMYSLIVKHLTAEPPPIPGLEPQVQAVLDQALAKDPAQRTGRAGELAMHFLAAIFGLSRLPASGGGAPLEQLAGLQEVLELLNTQARAYQFALPANNYPARAAVTALSELAKRALNEAQDLAAALRPAAPAAHPFSPRELQVLTLTAQGLTNKEIAYRLNLSERTVQFHLNSVFNKTGAQSRTEAVALAMRQGWISLKTS